MPIFMDRHDVSETVTAENVAQLHQQDLKIQDRFGCRGLTYWFDSVRGTAFCLIEAPDMSAIQSMHDYAHGQVPNQVIEVDTAIVESFLGRIGDPEKKGDSSLNIIDEPAFRILMLVTIPHGLPSTWEDLNLAVRPLAGVYGGHIVRQSANRIMLSFTSVSRAVHAAFEIHSRFDRPPMPMRNTASLKIGLSAGVPVTDKGSFFEDTIKLAERMCKIVRGEIILSSEVKELYDSENPCGLPEEKKAFCLSPMDEHFLTSLMDFTESVWNDTNFKVDDLGRPVGCSKSQLYRKMMSLTGKSPNSFIRDYRLSEALVLLNKSTKNISEVAFETGFNSPSYFSKCFHKHYGRKPSDYLAAVNS